VKESEGLEFLMLILNPHIPFLGKRPKAKIGFADKARTSLFEIAR